MSCKQRGDHQRLARSATGKTRLQGVLGHRHALAEVRAGAARRVDRGISSATLMSLPPRRRACAAAAASLYRRCRGPGSSRADGVHGGRTRSGAAVQNPLVINTTTVSAPSLMCNWKLRIAQQGGEAPVAA